MSNNNKSDGDMYSFNIDYKYNYNLDIVQDALKAQVGKFKKSLKITNIA